MSEDAPAGSAACKPWLTRNVLSLVAKPMLAIVTTLNGVLALRLTDRPGKEVLKAPRDALLADSVSDATCGRAFGFHRSMDTLGALVAW